MKTCGPYPDRVLTVEGSDIFARGTGVSKQLADCRTYFLGRWLIPVGKIGFMCGCVMFLMSRCCDSKALPLPVWGCKSWCVCFLCVVIVLHKLSWLLSPADSGTSRVVRHRENIAQCIHIYAHLQCSEHPGIIPTPVHSCIAQVHTATT